MKKLNLRNIRVGQTIYFVNDNLFETVPWGEDNPVKVWVEQLRVTNDPIPPLGTQLITEGKISAKALREAAEFYSFNRPPHFKATRKQAERYAEQERRRLNR
ncbi:coil containing protein [Vibrio phage 1.151.O._10N.222.46.B1]|nr:coil containing protein [Vibrio phage 1.151.O._10N.222.46.B1]